MDMCSIGGSLGEECHKMNYSKKDEKVIKLLGWKTSDIIES